MSLLAFALIALLFLALLWRFRSALGVELDDTLADGWTAIRTFSWISFVRTVGERLIEWADAADERRRDASPCVVIKFEKLTGKRS